MRTSVLSLVLATSVTAGLTAPAHAADLRPFSVQDLVTMQRVSDPRPSPDGKWIAYVLRSTDLDANRGRTDLWLVGVDGKGARRLTTSAENESSPRWAADGRSIYFLSARGGPQQVWRLRLDGGESEKVTSLPLDVASFRLSPDGTRAVVAASVFPDCASAAEGTMACTTRRLEEQARTRSSGRLYSRLPVRHWDEWLDGRRNHLFVVPLSGGAPVDLMKGMDADSPSRPFGGADDYAFTPDGKGVVFAAKDAGRAEAWSTNHDLWSVPADGSAAPRNLTPDNPAWDGHPVFSPDGKRLAWFAMEVPGLRGRPPPHPGARLARRRGARGGPGLGPLPRRDGLVGRRALAPRHRRPPGRPPALLHRRGHGAGANPGEGRQQRLALRGGRRGGLHPQRPGLPPPTSPDGPPRRLRRGPHHPRNEAALAGVAFGDREQFTFAGWNGETVHGWVVKPVGFEPGKRYPVAFLIHGGPQGSFGDQFHYRWNPQIYAAAGYAVVMIDFHGSTGYGRKFTDSIGGDWGGKPLEDLQKGLAAALERHPWMDGERVAALGASYGGYMINWIEGAWPIASVAGEPRRKPRRAPRLLRHRGSFLVPGAGARWDPLAGPGGLPEAQPGEPREELEDAHPGRPRRARLPRGRHPGAIDLHGGPAHGRTERVPPLPGREPLGAEAGQQHPVARDGAALDRALDPTYILTMQSVGQTATQDISPPVAAHSSHFSASIT